MLDVYLHGARIGSLTRNYIGGIEGGERSPSVATVVKLTDSLDVSLADLFRQAERSAR